MTEKSNYQQALDALDCIAESDDLTTEMYLQEAQVHALLAIADQIFYFNQNNAARYEH